MIMAEEKIHIVIAETSPIISTGLSHTVCRLPGIPVRAIEIKDPDDLQDCLKGNTPDILVVNPFFGGVFDPAVIRPQFPDMKLIAVETMPLDRSARALFDDTIAITDDIEQIAAKIRKLSSSAENTEDEKEAISQREKEIIALVAKGMTNKEIADTLFLSVHTVITHRRNIARKLEIHSATGLTIYAIVNKLVDIADIHI